MATGTDSAAYVTSLPSIQRAVGKLVQIRTHEHFAGYLALLKTRRASGGAGKVQDIVGFHDEFLSVPGDPKLPYVSPFKSRGHGKIAEINGNIPGSYSPASLRPDKPLRKLFEINADAGYVLKSDMKAASELLLYGKKLPALSLAIFLYRNFAFRLDTPHIARVLEIFRDEFGLRDYDDYEAQLFETLFVDDTASFSDNDLEPFVAQP